MSLDDALMDAELETTPDEVVAEPENTEPADPTGYESVVPEPVPEPPRPKLRLAGMEFENEADMQAAAGYMQAEAQRARALEQELAAARQSQAVQPESTKQDEGLARLQAWREEKWALAQAAAGAEDYKTMRHHLDEREVVTQRFIAAQEADTRVDAKLERALEAKLEPLLNHYKRLIDLESFRGNPHLADLHPYAELIVDLQRSTNMKPDDALAYFRQMKEKISGAAAPTAARPTAPIRQPVALESPASDRPTATKRQSDASETETYKSWWKTLRG